MTAMGEKAAPLKRVIEVLNDVVQMALNFLINKVAPVAIFCMIARAFAVYGVEYISPTLVWIATTIVVSLLLVVTIYPIDFPYNSLKSIYIPQKERKKRYTERH